MMISLPRHVVTDHALTIGIIDEQLWCGWEHDGHYVALEDPGTLYRLTPNSTFGAIEREALAPTHPRDDENDADWWFYDELGEGDYYAEVGHDGHSGGVYFGLTADGVPSYFTDTAAYFRENYGIHDRDD